MLWHPIGLKEKKAKKCIVDFVAVGDPSRGGPKTVGKEFCSIVFFGGWETKGGNGGRPWNATRGGGGGGRQSNVNRYQSTQKGDKKGGGRKNKTRHSLC